MRSGARKRFDRRFIEDALASWEEHGPAVLEVLRHEDVATYAKLMASLLSKQLKYEGDAANMTLEQVEAVDAVLVNAQKQIPEKRRPLVIGISRDEIEKAKTAN